MTVTTPREKWTDERLDDLNKRVDRGFEETKKEMKEGFNRVDADIHGLRNEMNGLRGEMNARFERVDARFDKIDERFESLYKLLLVIAGTIIASMIGLTGALIGTSAF